MKFENVEAVIWGWTPKAKLYKIKGKDIWVPNSVCTWAPAPNYTHGNIPGTLTIQDWWCKKNGIK